MITGFCGTPGSGKSYDAIVKLVANLRSRRVVYSNIDGLDKPIHRVAIAENAGLSIEELDELLFHFESKEMDNPEFWDLLPVGCLLMIDEVHFNFNARDWQSPKNRAFVEFCSIHRKRGMDIVLITQDMEKVDKQARGCIEWTYYFRKVNYFGNLVKKRYTRHTYSCDDTRGKPIAQSFHTYNPRYFACYESYTNKAAKEINFMQHANILKHPIFFALPVVVVIFLYFFSKSSLATGDIFGTDKIKKRSGAAIANNNKASNNPVVQKHYSSSAAPAPGRLPVAAVMKPISTVRSPVALPDPAPTWARYPVEAYLELDGRRWFLIHGRLVDPSKCRHFDRQSMTVNYFGLPLTPPSRSPASTLVASVAPNSVTPPAAASKDKVYDGPLFPPGYQSPPEYKPKSQANAW